MATKPRTTRTTTKPKTTSSRSKPRGAYHKPLGEDDAEWARKEVEAKLEKEAKEFYNTRLTEAVNSDENKNLAAYQFYAGSALSGLLASGKYIRAEELVEESFRYADLMILFKKK